MCAVQHRMVGPFGKVGLAIVSGLSGKGCGGPRTSQDMFIYSQTGSGVLDFRFIPRWLKLSCISFFLLLFFLGAEVPILVDDVILPPLAAWKRMTVASLKHLCVSCQLPHPDGNHRENLCRGGVWCQCNWELQLIVIRGDRDFLKHKMKPIVMLCGISIYVLKPKIIFFTRFFFRNSVEDNPLLLEEAVKGADMPKQGELRSGNLLNEMTNDFKEIHLLPALKSKKPVRNAGHLFERRRFLVDVSILILKDPSISSNNHGGNCLQLETFMCHTECSFE